MPGQAQAVEGAPVVVHGSQGPHVANGGQIIQELEVLGGSQLNVSTVGRLSHQNIKFIVFRWVRITKAVGEGRREQGIAAQPAAQYGRVRIRTVKVPQAANA